MVRSAGKFCNGQLDLGRRIHHQVASLLVLREHHDFAQILDTGQLFFSVRVRNEDGEGAEHREVLSRPFWTPSLSGKWLHLVTTYSVEKKRTTHYLNGSVLHQETIPDHQLVPVTRFGRSTIGNWTSPQRPDAHFAIRNLNGSMDEFALFADALTDDEIKEIYNNGKP